MGHSMAGEHGAAQRNLPSRRLADADGEGNRDRPETGSGHAPDNQSGGCETSEDPGERMVTHPGALADLDAPPGRLGMPAGLAVRRMRADAAVLQPLDMRPVETPMRAVEQEDAAGFKNSCGLGQNCPEVVHVS